MSEEKARQQAREGVLRKHKAERKELRKVCNDALSGKKGDERAAAEKENAERSDAMAARHAAELEAFDAGEEVEGVEPVAAAPAPVLGANGKPLSKTQRRREKEKAKQREDEKRRAELRAGQGPSAREIELERIAKALGNLGLQVKEMEADGHCMFRAVADQLAQSGKGSIDASTKEPHLLLRSMCTQFMKAHRHEFEPFVAAESEEPMPFERYLERMQKTSEWGGQLELRALAGALETPIKVVDAERGEALVMGEEFSGEPLVITFHRHFLALGEHYNSAEPQRAASE